MKLWKLLVGIALWTPAPAPATPPQVRIGSKAFTESVILGELLAHLVESAGARALHQRELGGTQVLWKALRRGDIDVYPEYTGTITQEILAGQGVEGEEEIRRVLAAQGVRMSRPLGFNNTYAIGMRRRRAASLGIEKISDLRLHPELRFGFSNEFMERGDGWPSLREHYGLPQRRVRGLAHDLAYRGLQSGRIDAIDLYSTDAEIRYYHLRTLEDDQGHFPTYEAVLLWRADLRRRAPRALAAMQRLEGRIPAALMIEMNARAKLEKVPASRVAAEFLAAHLNVRATSGEESAAARLLRTTREHLFLVGLSLGAAVLVALPLGIVAARLPWLGQFVLGFAGIVQTIPSLALLVLMIPLLGIGGPPAIAALFLYSLLPIVRNTCTGLRDIPPALIESAAALGLPPAVRLRRVELPMASRTILAGIKTSAVINVGFATLGAFIGAGGYGQTILTAIRLDDMGLMLQGALPAALLALVAQGLFELLEVLLVPRGLRLQAEE